METSLPTPMTARVNLPEGISDQGLQKWHQVQHPSQLRQWNGHQLTGFLKLACSFREEWNRKGRGKERDSISGWWWTYPSEKYESQLGWFQTEWNVIKNQRWSQTTNQDWVIVGQSYYCYISLLYYYLFIDLLLSLLLSFLLIIYNILFFYSYYDHY